MGKLGMLKVLWQWLKDIILLNRRVKAIEDTLRNEVRLDAEVREEAKRQRHALCENVECRDGAVYLKKATPGRDTGPYCPTCWRPPNPDTLVRLHTEGVSFEEFDEYMGQHLILQWWVCGDCNTRLKLSIY